MGIPEAMLPQRVTRVRPAEVADTYGNTTLNYGVTATRTTDIPAWLQQGGGSSTGASEPRADGRDATVGIWTLLTNESDLLATDRIEWTGPTGALVLEIEGPPEPVYTPGGLHHVEATLRVVTG